MFDSIRFWLDRGVAGFRLDAIATLFEDPGLRDEWTSRTRKERYDIVAFVAKENVDAAIDVGTRILSEVERLRHFP